MTVWWTLFDEGGQAAGRSEEFPDRGAAEAWLTERWAGLLEAGVVEVALHDGEQEAYRMSLRER